MKPCKWFSSRPKENDSDESTTCHHALANSVLSLTRPSSDMQKYCATSKLQDKSTIKCPILAHQWQHRVPSKHPLPPAKCVKSLSAGQYAKGTRSHSIGCCAWCLPGLNLASPFIGALCQNRRLRSERTSCHCHVL